jgi:hypothetical protein
MDSHPSVHQSQDSKVIAIARRLTEEDRNFSTIYAI